MKVNNVPQDQDPTYEGATKLCYALDEQGQFVPVSTNGWHVEETVKDLAWKAIEKDLESTRVLVQQGKRSALEYFMKRRLMDPLLLGQNMGLSPWRVKWHLRPRVFRKLNPQWLQKYAICLEIPVETLKTFNGDEHHHG